MLDSSFFALLALILFFGLLAYLGVPRFLLGALDKRATNIENELAEARRLREEAQALLAEYQRKREAAEKEAEDIVASARADAERIAQEARIAMQEAVSRRTKMAEDKIAMAEADALKEVRSAASQAAIAAASAIIAEKVKGEKASAILDSAIGEVSSRLN